MNNVYKKLKIAESEMKSKTDFKPEIGIVLGSGLGDFAESMDVEQRIPYGEITGFPISTVEGHSGEFILGKVEGVSVICMKGRVHFYEGYSMDDVVMPIRLMGLMGAKTLILTNAAGGVNENWKPGDFMLINDHISTFVPSPLRGENIDELGRRFPDMSEVYVKELGEKAKEAAEESGIDLKEGVYMQTPGPNFETPAEVRMARVLGADAVGMSTACEAMAAQHMGMNVTGISCISNMAAGVNGIPLRHEEVQETTDRVGKDFEKLVKNLIKRI